MARHGQAALTARALGPRQFGIDMVEAITSPQRFDVQLMLVFTRNRGDAMMIEGGIEVRDPRSHFSAAAAPARLVSVKKRLINAR